ncbi:hypothetical protein D3C73_1546470 [compost metagenome]
MQASGQLLQLIQVLADDQYGRTGMGLNDLCGSRCLGRIPGSKPKLLFSASIDILTLQAGVHGYQHLYAVHSSDPALLLQ